jgi:bacteriocin-like protein
MKTSELIVLTDNEMESVQGGLISERAPTRRPLLRLILLLLLATLGPTTPTRAPEV